jgi:cyclophilin family peptidyl-prolyl cis-trans isomerase
MFGLFYYMTTTSTIEPTQFRAGLTVSWEKSDFSNYQYADGFTTAKYTISGQNGSATITGYYSGGTWTFTLAAVDNTLTAGTYTLFGYVQDGSGNKYEIYAGDLQVLASLVTAAQTDTRSHVKKVLDAIEAVMERRATKEQESTQLPNGVAISLMPMADLIKAHENYSYKYQQEIDTNRVRNGGSRRKVLSSFI